MQVKRNYLFSLDKEGTEAFVYKLDAKLWLRVGFDKSKIVNFNVGYMFDLEKWST